jgi:hypothetical protein
LPSEQADSFEITFQVVEDDIFDDGSGKLMCKFIVIVEEGDMKCFGVAQVSHHDGFIEFALAVFEDVDFFSYFSFFFVFIFVFEVDMAICVDVV